MTYITLCTFCFITYYFTLQVTLLLQFVGRRTSTLVFITHCLNGSIRSMTRTVKAVSRRRNLLGCENDSIYYCMLLNIYNSTMLLMLLRKVTIMLLHNFNFTMLLMLICKVTVCYCTITANVFLILLHDLTVHVGYCT